MKLLRGFKNSSIKKILMGLLHLGRKGLLFPIELGAGAVMAVKHASKQFPESSPRNGLFGLFDMMIGVYAFMYVFWPSYIINVCGLSGGDVGSLMAIFMLGRFGLSNFFGVWAVRVQKIVAIRVGFFLAIFAAVWLVTTTTFWSQALASFIFGGTWGAAANLIKAYALGHLNPKGGPNHQDSLGFLYAVGAIGFVILGFVLGFVKDMGGVAWAMAGLPIFMSLATAFTWFMPNDADYEEGKGKNNRLVDHVTDEMGIPGRAIVAVAKALSVIKNTRQSLVFIGSHMKQKRMWGFFVAAMLMWASFQAYWAYLTPLLESMGFSNFQISLIWNIGVAMEILCSWNIGRIKDWLGGTVNVFTISLQSAALRWTMLSGYICLTWWFGHTAFGFWVVIVAIQLLHGIGFSGFIIPGAQISQSFFQAPHDGIGQTLYGSLVEGLAAAAGCVASGLLWAAAGPELTFLIAGFCCSVGWMVADYTQRPKKTLKEGIQVVKKAIKAVIVRFRKAA